LTIYDEVIGSTTVGNKFLGMDSMAKAFILVILSTVCSYGQIRPNSIGVVYLTAETNETYQLTISLPVQTLEKSDLNSFWNQQTDRNLPFKGEITFFDKGGELLSIEQKVNAKVDQWCENDGGSQYRPTWTASMRRGNSNERLRA
jgi:hypothetical protein